MKLLWLLWFVTCLDRNSHCAKVCIFTIRICNFSNFVALCTDDTDTTVSSDKCFRAFWGVCSNLSPISSNVSSVRTWCRWLTFPFFTEPVSLNHLARLLIVLGLGTCLPGNYSKFASCFRTRLSAFHICIWEALYKSESSCVSYLVPLSLTMNSVTHSSSLTKIYHNKENLEKYE